MQNELDIVRDVSQRLDRAGIAYMLTGSMAMNYYAQPRMTRDIDVVVALAPADADKIVDLFRADYYVSEEAVRDSISAESIFNLIHNESVIKVDCIVRKNTPYRRVEFDRRKQIKIDDFSTWIASKEDLIISKLFWAMPPVTDTSPEIATRVRDRIMKFSGAERFIIGARMFESARAVVLASLPKDISEAERKRILYERVYGEPFREAPPENPKK